MRSFVRSRIDWKSGFEPVVTASDRRIVNGNFGPSARRISLAWIARGLVHFVAS